MEGTPASVTITGTGGSGTGYAWSLLGSAPPGLSLGATGTPGTTLSGTPGAAGPFSFTIRLEDSIGAAVTRTYSVTVNPGLDVVAQTLPGATRDLPYAAKILGANGSLAGYTWDVVGGTFPPGLTITAIGTPAARIGGAPSSTGTFNFTLRLRDNGGNTATESMTIAVAAPSSALEVVTRVLPFATTGTAYSQVLAARGGIASITWSAPGGTPPGLTLASNGTLSGTPTTTGVTFFTVQATDGATTVERELSLEVKGLFRWVGYVADHRVTSRDEVFFVDIGGASPSAPTSAANNWLAAADVATADAFQKFSPDGRKLAFRADLRVDGIDELWVVDLAGSTAGQAVSVSGTIIAAGDITNFVWSPDSKRLLFNADAITDADTELFMVDVSGPTPGPRQKINGTLAVGGDVPLDPENAWAFSPDGRRVAYLAEQNADNLFELFVVDVSGPTPGTPARVNSNLPDPANDDVAAFFWVGPDAIVYVAEQSTTGVNELYYSDVGGALPATPVKISGTLASGQISEGNVLVSPDGKRIALIAALSTASVNELYLIDLETGTPSTPARLNLPYTLGFETALSARWSPSGNRIAYAADESVSAVTDLFIVDLVGSSRGGAQLASAQGLVATNDPATGTGGAGYDWSPNSSRLYYRDTATSAELWLVDASTAIPGTPQRVNTTLVTGGSVTSFAVSPSSGRIAYRADQSVDEQFELFVVDVSGSAPLAPQRANDAIVSGGDVSEFFWARDSNRLVYRGDERVDNDTDVYVVNVSGAFPFGSTRLNAVLAAADVDRVDVQD